MSFLFGKQQQLSNVNPATQGADTAAIQWLMSQGFGGVNPAGPMPTSFADPYRAQFAQNNAGVFGQAKEAAGNLTGSGLGNSLGIAAQRTANDQSSFLANLWEQRRQADANRFAQFALGLLGSPAGGVTNTYRPGFLDYLSQGATAAAGGGAFNSLFSSGGAPAFAPSEGQLGPASNYSFPRG